MNLSAANRVLAIDLRPRRLGFAAFHGTRRILDFGTRKFASETHGILRVSVLIQELGPAAIVLRKILAGSPRDRYRTRALQRSIEKLARRFHVPIAFVDEKDLRYYFQGDGKCTKHHIATALAEKFEGLAWKLPSKRKCYEREPWVLAMFDAVALGVVYMAKARGTTAGQNA